MQYCMAERGCAQAEGVNQVDGISLHVSIAIEGCAVGYAAGKDVAVYKAL